MVQKIAFFPSKKDSGDLQLEIFFKKKIHKVSGHLFLYAHIVVYAHIVGFMLINDDY